MTETAIAFVAGIGLSALAIRAVGFGSPSGSVVAGGGGGRAQAPPSPEIKAIQEGMQELLESKRRSVRTHTSYMLPSCCRHSISITAVHRKRRVHSFVQEP